MHDDPLFDPWWTPEIEEPWESRSPRWRSPAGGMLPPPPPMSRDMSPPRVPAADSGNDVRPEPAISSVTPPEVPVSSTREEAPASSPRLASAASPRAIADRRRMRSLTNQLRDVLLPRLVDVRSRLELARHETTLDDRLDTATASVRFRVRPHIGPFDEQSGIGSVLEIGLEPSSPTNVVARLWMDPLATGPAEEVHIHSGSVTSDWLDTLLLDFIEKTLRLS